MKYILRWTVKSKYGEETKEFDSKEDAEAAAYVNALDAVGIDYWIEEGARD